MQPGGAAPARPSQAQRQIRDLIVRIARETDWGVTRILGELRKLGVKGWSVRGLADAIETLVPERLNEPVPGLLQPGQAKLQHRALWLLTAASPEAAFPPGRRPPRPVRRGGQALLPKGRVKSRTNTFVPHAS